MDCARKSKDPARLAQRYQDLNFLRPFALLPQGVYPSDLRDATIAHTGGDIYGSFSPRSRWGMLSYTVYAGHRSDSIYSGYRYLLSQFGTHFKSYGGLQYGADLHWDTHWKGLLLGVSRMNEDIHANGNTPDPFSPGVLIAYAEHSRADWTNQFYGQYRRGPLQVEAEYRRYVRDQLIFGGASENPVDVRGWYASGTYRLVKKVEIGAYYPNLGTPLLTGYDLSCGFVSDLAVQQRRASQAVANISFQGYAFE